MHLSESSGAILHRQKEKKKKSLEIHTEVQKTKASQSNREQRQYCRKSNQTWFQLTLQSHSSKQSRRMAPKQMHRSMERNRGLRNAKAPPREKTASSTSGALMLDYQHEEGNSILISHPAQNKTQLPPSQGHQRPAWYFETARGKSRECASIHRHSKDSLNKMVLGIPGLQLCSHWRVYSCSRGQFTPIPNHVAQVTPSRSQSKNKTKNKKKLGRGSRHSLGDMGFSGCWREIRESICVTRIFYMYIWNYQGIN